MTDEPSLFMEPGSRMVPAMLHSRISRERHWLKIGNAALLVHYDVLFILAFAETNENMFNRMPRRSIIITGNTYRQDS